jgi:hypothetical protein
VIEAIGAEVIEIVRGGIKEIRDYHRPSLRKGRPSREKDVLIAK